MSKGKINEAYKVVFHKPMDEHEYFELEKVKKSRADRFKVFNKDGLKGKKNRISVFFSLSGRTG